MFPSRPPEHLIVHRGSRRTIVWGQTPAGNLPAKDFLDGVDDETYERLAWLWTQLAEEGLLRNTSAWKALSGRRLCEFRVGDVRLLAREHRSYVILLRGCRKQAWKLRAPDLDAAQRLGDAMASRLEPPR